jgi:hypothetical protein
MNGLCKRIRQESETISICAVRQVPNRDVITQNFERDIKNKKAIFSYMWIKKQEGTHA